MQKSHPDCDARAPRKTHRKASGAGKQKRLEDLR
jgi:hypothetical protein